ncbi:hypothetical protein HDV01_006528 [Terramyces sp. JEL0728]|nr:hypothetical protein HDV01_006528 [Terramyces sp. JEL0728]
MQSFFGFVNTPADAALLIYSSTDGSNRVQSVKRRLASQERNQIKSGSVYVFCEQESGMRRWTDGMRWSKSRVEGQFLVYRRIEPEPTDVENEQAIPNKRRRVLSQQTDSTIDDDSIEDDNSSKSLSVDFVREGSESSLIPSKGYRDDVLCKKTFAISIKGRVSHVICYYSKQDVMDGVLKTPSSMEMFADIKVPNEYVDPSNFRLHPKGSTVVEKPLNNTFVTISPRNTPPRKREILVQKEASDRTVTVHCIGDYQPIKLLLTSDFKDFQRIIKHAFHFPTTDSIKITVGNNTIISDQVAYSMIFPGDTITVSRYQNKSELLWLPPSEEKEEALTPQSLPEDGYCVATNEAAMALASLAGISGRGQPQDSPLWGLSTDSKSNSAYASVM